MKKSLSTFLLLLLLCISMTAVQAGEVAIYTGGTSWIDAAQAAAQAEITRSRLEAAGIACTVFTDPDLLAGWVEDHTNSSELDVLILYGLIPSSIYGAGNAQPDGSIAELFIESTDGNAIINHGDWMFYVSDGNNNGDTGLRNMMDIPAMTTGGGTMEVTAEGSVISPNLYNFTSNRPLRIDLLTGDWFVEASLAQLADGTQADPVILRDGERGRVIPIYQTNSQNNPKGAVAADIIAWLMEAELTAGIGLSTTGPANTVTGSPSKLNVSLVDDLGYLTISDVDVAVDLFTDSADGAFDTLFNGAFDGSVTSVVIPAGQASTTAYYVDTAEGNPVLSAEAADLTTGVLDMTVFENLEGDPGEVMIYTGHFGWMDETMADTQAQICKDSLDTLGITNTWLSDPADETAVADWVSEKTENGEIDVLVLYGSFPDSIYPLPNLQIDDSLAELFIESTDGDVIINHGDWMFYVSSAGCCNGEAGLQNMMDLPGITMGGYNNTNMYPTAEAAIISPSLTTFMTDRPLHLDGLANDWFVEASMAQAQSIDGMLADPIIVRDGNRGRIISAFQANAQDDPKGLVAAEMISWLYGFELGAPTGIAISSNKNAAVLDDPVVQVTVQLQNIIGSPVTLPMDIVVTMQTDSGSGAFDVAADGSFDGSMTAFTIAAGSPSVSFYYRDDAVGTSLLTATVGTFDPVTLEIIVVERNDFATPGTVAIYTGETWWISKEQADLQAALCAERLAEAGITTTIFSMPTDKTAVAEWVEGATGNGLLDVLILYGEFPETIYASGNAQPNGSLAELFIESTDGDAIIGHADWMFYGHGRNGTGGLQNMMDIPTIRMDGADNITMTVTAEGQAIAPNLASYVSVRSMPYDQLTGNWFVETSLAQNTEGTRGDPAIVRDGNAGRLIPLYMTNNVIDAKGAVAAEVIAWMMGTELDPVQITKLGLAGSVYTVEGNVVPLKVSLFDTAEMSRTSSEDIVVDLVTDSATGAFDTTFTGAFDGSITSVTIPAGVSSVMVYYKDTAPVVANLEAQAANLATASLQMEVLEDLSGEPGDVVFYTGDVNWIDKAVADAQAQICVNRLSDAGISASILASTENEAALLTWLETATGNEKVDILVLFGRTPAILYPAANAQPDGSPLEAFIETTDGDVIMNFGDYMFYVSSSGNSNNGDAGLRYIMDNNSGIAMWGDYTMEVTGAGSSVSPSLAGFVSNRPLNISQLDGQWFVELSLAQDAAGIHADPVIVRDGNLGRLVPIFGTGGQNEQKGTVCADVVAYIMGTKLVPSQVGISGPGTTVTGTPVELSIEIQDGAGIPTPSTSDLVIDLTTDAASGAFDLAWSGSYSEASLSVTIPAGEITASVFYVMDAAGSATLTITSEGFTDGTFEIEALDDLTGEPGEVAIYTGAVGWIDKAPADAQAQICYDMLDEAGITATLFPNSGVDEENALADWVASHTENGQLDVLVLYGAFPQSIYPAANAQPDGSIAELFIESTDGDLILNHADWMFYVSTGDNNGGGGLNNMMDSPVGIDLGGADNTPVYVTGTGAAIAPSLADFQSDRSVPLQLQEIDWNWFVEAALAKNAGGTRADPVIVRDGNLGRLAVCVQTMLEDNPKGAVAAEMITWLMSKYIPSEGVNVFVGDANNDQGVNIADAVSILSYLFAGGDEPLCAKALDVNDDDGINIADAVAVLSFLFSGGSLTGPDGNAIGDPGCITYDPADIPATISGLPGCNQPCTP